MGFPKHQDPIYIPLQPENEEGDQMAHHRPRSRSASLTKHLAWISLLLLITISLFAIGTIHGRGLLNRLFLRKSTDVKEELSKSCVDPPIRREWRSLASSEKLHYLNSVQCLRQMPSRLGPNLTVYDDFPHIHNAHGMYAHNAAPFLPWHRWFIHIYEKVLREDCGYQGFLPYWDWSLDWEAPSEAPVWHPVYGFGGDSRPSSPPRETFVAGEDRCVVDGLFAGLQVHFFDTTDNPHCLSRGFLDEQPFHETSLLLQPSVIEHVLSGRKFKDFFAALESGPHDAIPMGIGGDFRYTIAPYDPVFFLHHAQLDRLWWRWQQMQTSNAIDYNGPSEHESEVEASLDDLLRLGEMATNLKIKDVMSTESDMLCYRY